MKHVQLLVLAALFIGGCKKDKDPIEILPPATQEGKNTMGCRVNGVVKVYSGELSTTQPHGVRFHYIISSNSAAILGNGKQDGDVHLWFYADPLKADTLYTYLGSLSGLTVYDTNANQFSVKLEDSFNHVKLTRIDDQVAAGIFQFRGYTSGGDSVYVTDGRFDIAR